MEYIWKTLIDILIFSTPLIVTALGGMFSEKSGIVNIGLEGIMTFSAFLTALGILLAESAGIHSILALAIGILFGIIGGLIFAALHATLTIKFQVDQIISGTAINIIGLGLAIFLTKIIYGASSTPFKSTFNEKIFGIPLLVLIVIALVFVSKFIMDKTKFGLRLKACGENPYAASSVGINVERVRFQAVLISGVLGAIGGASMVILISSNFSANTIAGNGFIALAVLIFGRWNPIGILFAGLLFGFLRKLGTIITVLPSDFALPLILVLIILIACIAVIVIFKNKIINVLLMIVVYIMILNLIYFGHQIPSVYYSILPYIMTIVALVYYSQDKVEPKALGKPYEVN